MPSPGRIDDEDGEIIPASSMNFYIGNTSVVVPLYGAKTDAKAVAAIAKLFVSEAHVRQALDAVQIHGGNGFALEYAISRVLCDARILNIFEGAAEIQAQVIARRLLENRN